ncbi:MAG: glycosyltransferase family 2 protein [Eubacterium sp.]|nr:glycosyltransferase family 2 protein [Eubacterium sp.]
MIAVIVPIYNTEKYLQETIDSVINQTLSFTSHVRLILLDDASTDGSLALCEEYQKQYPDNIVIKHYDENQGVSALRNQGLRMCREQGDELVTFLDSDDKLEESALERAVAYFKKHEDIHIATIELMCFGAVEEEQRLNWRFREAEVVDIKKQFNFPHYYVGGVFVRGDALQQLHFDETMNFWEDALAINQIIINEGKYGLIRGACYYYRKREDHSSLVDTAWRNKDRYTTFLETGYWRLFQYSRKKKHRIIPYVQYVVAYHMRLIMMKSKQAMIEEILTEEELENLRNDLQKLLKKIRVKIILSIPTSLPIIEGMLSMRAGKQVRAKRVYKDGDCVLVYKGVELARMSDRTVKLFHVIHDPQSEFDGMWRGRFCTPIYAMKVDDYIFAEHNGKRINSVEHPCGKQIFILGKRLRCYYHAGFAISIPKEWDRAVFGIHIAEANADILMNEIVFDEVKQIYFEEKTEENEEMETNEEE